MSEEEINVAIAECCGWKRWSKMFPGRVDYGWKSPGGSFVKKVPNYCGNLNAMAEVEDTLTDDQFRVYFNKLESQLPYPRLRRSLRHVCTAKARNRAEAFLVALGKWSE